ncbi:MAG: NUDIX domain-containing protein [Bacteroidales bacterium]|nr:NUDIX domain-containing protein [Bacteroidales bacterium]
MELPEIRHFNIRVYGLVINNKNEILLTDEYLLNREMTKFPGGGLKFGEGPADCILREALEEFGQEVEIIGHFYTTHFFQRALFYDDHQLISIYYRIRFKEPVKFRISDRPFDFPEMVNGSQSFRWAAIETMNDDDLSFPVDRYVLHLLKNRHNRPMHAGPEHCSGDIL